MVRVDVSVDGGQNWQVADLIRDEMQEYNRQWAWTLWRIDAEVPPEVTSWALWSGDISVCPFHPSTGLSLLFVRAS